MRKLQVWVMLFLAVLFLGACGGNAKEATADYTTAEAEKALNDGENIEGKTVKIKVDKLVPDSAFGYNIQTGEHLNFVSNDHPEVKEGDELIVKVEKVTSTMGSYIMTYVKE